MGWWDLGGSSLDEVCGDRPADLVADALAHMLAQRGEKPTRAQLLCELAAVVAESGKPTMHLTALRVACDGETRRYEPTTEVPAWGQTLLTGLKATWRESWKRAPTMREVSSALTFVLAPAFSAWTSDGTSLEDLEVEWNDARGRLAIQDTLCVIRGCLERTLPPGIEVMDLVATLEDGAEVRAPGTTVVDAAVKALTGTLKQHEAAGSLAQVLELAFRGIADDQGRYALEREGVLISRLSLVARAKHARVRHATLGTGLVLDERDGKARIRFDAGAEKVILSRVMTIESPAGTPFTTVWELPVAYREHLRRK